MTWVRIDDRYPTHRKMLRAGPLAIALDVAGMCYCAGHATDGYIPTEALAAAAPFLSKRQAMAAADCLVNVGRWIPVEGGWRIHDFLAYNPSAGEREDKRGAAAERTRRWRDRKRGSDTSHKGGAKRGSDASSASQRDGPGDATPPCGLKKPKGELLQTTPGDTVTASVTPSTSAASPSLVASGASSAAEPQQPPGQQLSGNGARCRHGNDSATCGVCSAAVGTPPPSAARAKLDAMRAQTRYGGDTNPTETEPETSAK